MIGAIAAGAAPVIGGVLGNILSQGDRDAANAAAARAADILSQVGVPTEEQLRVIYDKLSKQGELTPELEQALSQQSSELNGITQDQGLKDIQRGALEQLVQSGKTGLNAEDSAALNKIRNSTAQQQQAQQQAILQNLSQRGMGGSGQELAAKLAASQQGAELASQQGDSQAAMAQSRALQAIAQSGQLSSQMSQADFDQKAKVAQAQDVINQFNTANQSNVQARNVNSKNTAQATNLAESQRIADTNTGLSNKEKDAAAQNLKDIYNMQLGKAKGLSSLSMNDADRRDADAERTAAMWTGVGSGVGKGIAGLS